MLKNFLDPKLFPKALCTSPCMDNYEVDNLVSPDFANKCRGFIAYSSIKPPIDVDFEFICSVNIHYIIVNTTVGQQKCTGIELFIKNTGSNYESVSKVLYDKAGVVFCNSKFYSNAKPPCDITNYHLAYFKGHFFKLFLSATSIRLRIFRTHKSVPCLASVEVWGEVAKSCSVTTKETVEKLINKNLDTKQLKVETNTNNSEFTIPEDFKDDLTYEIMTIPMTLPSGKTIDQRTLEKHIQNEKEFGRKPGDPFTGLKFTDTIKPTLNVALKSRIDMFILENSHRSETFNWGRTLGRSSGHVILQNKISQHKISHDKISQNITSNSNKKRKIDEEDELDRIIRQAKETPGFTSYLDNASPNIQCVKCNKEGEYFYQLPCDHLYCRCCLLTVCDQLKCDICALSFIKGDIKKVNL